MFRLSLNLGAWTSWKPSGPLQACNGIALPFTFHFIGDYLAFALRRQTVIESVKLSVSNQPTGCDVRDPFGFLAEITFLIQKLVDLMRFCFRPCNPSFLQSWDSLNVYPFTLICALTFLLLLLLSGYSTSTLSSALRCLSFWCFFLWL